MQFLNQAGDVGGESLGTLLRVLDIATAAKHGSVGNALTRQAGLLTDPEARQAVAGSPLLAGFTGAYGNRIPNAGTPGELAQAGNPQLPPGTEVLGPGQQPGAGGSRFQAHLPAVLQTVEQLLKESQLAKNLAQIPYFKLKEENMRKFGTSDFPISSMDSEGKITRTNPAAREPLRLGQHDTIGTEQTPGGPRGVIRTAPPTPPEKPAPVEMVKAVTQGNAMLASLDNVLQLVEQGDTGTVQGPIAGRFAKSITNPLGYTSQNQAQFLNALEQMFNTYRLATTGQQASYQELERITKALPNANVDPQTFRANAIEIAKTTVRGILAKTQGAKEINRAIPDIDIPPRIAKLIQESGASTTTAASGGGTTTTTTLPPTTGTSYTPEELQGAYNRLHGKRDLRTRAR